MKRMFKRAVALVAALLTAVWMCLPASAAGMLYEFPADEGQPIEAPSALMMYMGVKSDQGVILYEKQADVRYQPGALMRVAMLGYAMKLIRAQHINIDTATAEYTLPLFNHYVAGTGLHVALMNFGETWTLRDLLTVSTLQTAADCAVTLATALSGSPEAFVEGLNGFAKELGCENSHFTNVTGLNEDGQYMSARDAMTFTRYAMQYAEVEKMLELRQYTVTPVSGGKERSWPTSNDMCRPSTPFYYTYSAGGKTGGTLTEVSVVEYGSKDGYEYMAVVMGAPRKNEKGEQTGTAYADARRLIRWGFLNFSYEMLTRKNEPAGRLPVTDSAGTDTVSLVAVRDLYTVVSDKVDLTAITRRVVTDKTSLTAPVKAGEPIGTLELYYEDKLLGTVELVTGEDVPYHFLYSVWSRVSAALFSGWTVVILVVIVGLVIGYVVFNVRYNRKRNKKWR